ncbi:MAG: Eco29kI family restriction endonuclease, partial [Pseudohongiellaceae bacterium]
MTKKESSVVPFNPLDKRHLGESVGQAMLRQSVFPLEDLKPFPGAGVYAIYYTGDFEGYEPISQANRKDGFRAPIYVGKAVPSGARKGGDLQAKPGRVLYNRIRQHLGSIQEATNLDPKDRDGPVYLDHQTRSISRQR